MSDSPRLVLRTLKERYGKLPVEGQIAYEEVTEILSQSRVEELRAKYKDLTIED